MGLPKEEIIYWLAFLDPGTIVSIDEDGLSLETAGGNDYLEVGGHGEDEEEG